MFTLPAYLYRGGTSKCWLFCEPDLAPYAPDESELSRILSAALGGDDPREINGVGGATTTTSKAAVITPTPGADSHLSYTFAQVGIGDGTVEYGSNCGNCATAIGLFALDQGYAPIVDGVSEVRMYNTNTDTVLTARVATPGGVVPDLGDARVPGTRTTGVGVELGFLEPAGGKSPLPTCNPIDEFPVGDRHASATLVSRGARDGPHLGVRPDQPRGAQARHRRPAGRLRDPAGRADRRERLRHRGAHALDDAPHPAIGLTSAVAAAAATPGGTVAEVLGGALSPENNRSLRIGTPGGIVAVDVTFAADGSMSHVGLQRAARRIAQAVLSIPLSRATAVAG